MGAQVVENSPRIERLPAGATLQEGRYEIASFIAEGGFAEVYEAKDRQSGRTVAIKTLHPSRQPDSRAAKKLPQEAVAGRALVHPNLIRVYDHFFETDRLFFVMERLVGWPLSDLIGRGPLPIVALLQIGIGAANGLYALHDNDIFHRDVKPDNLFVTRDAKTGRNGPTKILDLNAARFDRQLDLRTTRPKNVVGTLRYMSPEHLAGDAVDGRSDVYSLGLVLYEMVTSVQACMAHMQSVGRIDYVTARAFHERIVPPPVRTLRADCPEELERIIDQCLQKRPGDRYASAGDLSAALEALKAELDAQGYVDPSFTFGEKQIVLDVRSNDAHSVLDLSRAHTDAADGEAEARPGKIVRVVAPAGARDTAEDQEPPFPELTAAFDMKRSKAVESTADDVPKVLIRTPPASRRAPTVAGPVAPIRSTDGTSSKDVPSIAAPVDRVRLILFAVLAGLPLGLLALWLVMRIARPEVPVATIAVPTAALPTASAPMAVEPASVEPAATETEPRSTPAVSASAGVEPAPRPTATSTAVWKAPVASAEPPPAPSIAPAPEPTAAATAVAQPTAQPSAAPDPSIPKLYFDPRAKK